MDKADILKQLPKVLAGAGALGVPVTGYLAVKAGMKSERQLAESGFRGELYRDVTFKEKFKLTWKNYIPPVITGALSMAAIIGGCMLSAKQLAAATALASSLAAYKDKLEQKIEEKYGQDALNEIKKEVAEDLYSPTSIEETGDGGLLCYEGYTGRWFRSSERAVERAEKVLNRKFEAGNGEYLCMNDFYTLLNIAESHLGFTFGWPANTEYYDGDICFTNTLLEPNSFMNIPEKVLVIEPTRDSYPMECWQEV